MTDPILAKLAAILDAPASLVTLARDRKGKGIGVHGSSKKHDFGTPAYVFDPIHAEFAFDFDAAAKPSNTKLERFISPDANALLVPWGDYGRRAWLNPPYGSALPKFLRKVVKELDEGVLTVTLTPARTDTDWLHDLIFGSAAECWFVRKRIVFDGAPVGKDGRRLGAPFPSLVSVFDPDRRSQASPRFFSWDPLTGTPRKELL